jgi:HK97 family phage major capsid protein
MTSEITDARAEWRQAVERLEALTDRWDRENRQPHPDEARRAEVLTRRCDELHNRVRQLEAEERDRRARIAEARQVTLSPDSHIEQPGDGSADSDLYARGGAGGGVYARGGQRSYFADLYAAQRYNDPPARGRLIRHRQERQERQRAGVERRDLSSTDGVGGDFVAPIWLEQEWIGAVRAGRAFANIVRTLPLPPGTDSINLPKLLTGAATSAHADLGAVQETDPTTGTITVPVKTLAGQVDVSRQALERSAPGLDEVLLADLAADYAQRLDLQILTGSGSGANARGVLSDPNRIQVTWTQATPTIAGLFGRIADAAQQIAAQRFASATHIVMHPRRWAWITAAADTTGRPLIEPVGGQGSAAQPGQASQLAADGIVGTLQGLQVVIDPNLPTNLGAGTNEDVIVVTRAEDNVLFELPNGPVLRIFEDVLSGQLAVRLQAYSYFAFSSERLPKANATISGTGLTPPAFSS